MKKQRTETVPLLHELTNAMRDARRVLIAGPARYSGGGGGLAVKVGSAVRRNAKRRVITLARGGL